MFDDQFVGMREAADHWPYQWELFILDAAKEPKSITLSGFEADKEGGYKRDEKGNVKKQEFAGIYRFESDRLTVALRHGGQRPDKFELNARLWRHACGARKTQASGRSRGGRAESWTFIPAPR